MTPTPPPRLAISPDAGTQPGYAPISWTAVASLIVAVLFVLVLALLGVIAFTKKQPLIEQWLLFFPAVAVALAFVARRQIRASEGTRVGERYANAGWWLGLVGGLGYVAYLLAVDFTIRNDANQTFAEFATQLKEWNPDDPNDPHLAKAMLLTIDPGVRGGADSQKPEAMARFAGELAAFRQTDMVRVCGRGRGQVEFKTQGLKDWQQKPTEITCTLTATLVTPEGDFGLVVPMRAVVDDKKRRRWQIAPSTEGYVKSYALTPYGRMIAAVELSARAFGDEVLGTLGSDQHGYQSRYAFYAYVRPGLGRGDTQKLVDVTAVQIPALCGGLAAAAGEASWQDYLMEKVFAAPGGGRLSPDDAARMLFCWLTPGRLSRAGAVLRANFDVNPVFTVDPSGAEARLPVEVVVGGEGYQQRNAAKGQIVVRCPADADPKFFADLAAARQAAASAPRTPTQFGEVEVKRLPWRVIRIESDMKPVPNSPIPGGGQMPGPGM